MDGLLERYVWEKAATLLTIPYTVYSRYIAVMYIAELDISRSHVGPHFLATHFANFADMAPKSAIFREIAVIPCTPFVGVFREICSPRLPLIQLAGRNLLWASLAYLWNADGNTCCAMASNGRRTIDTSIVSQSRVLLIRCPCKSVPQTADQGKTNAFLIKSSLTTCWHPPFCEDGQVCSKSSVSAWLVDIPLAAMHTKIHIILWRKTV